MLVSALTIAAFIVAPAEGHAQPNELWPVKGKLLGKKDKKSEDVSGIACREGEGFPRRCVVIDDELQDAQYVEVTDGKIKTSNPIHLIDDELNGKPLSLDGEGVAHDNGYFYVMGSHGHPRDPQHKLGPEDIEASTAAASKVIRFRDAGNSPSVEVSTKLKPIFSSISTLVPFVDKPLDENGVTIEGIAVQSGRLYAGFREPSINNDQAAILSVNSDALFGGASADPKLDLLTLGAGRGIRDLAPFKNGLLVLAGPAGNTNRTYSVFWWARMSGDVKLLADLPALDGGIKPEAILPLDENAHTLRVLVLSDGAEEGAPRAFEITAP